jgi:flavin reductase (DIM6/NTAB) family NADH-FMN oxidoreductase RutF
MAKIEMGAFAYLYPLPAVLLGATVEGKPNYELVGNCAVVSLNPCALCVSSVKRHYTNRGIREHGVFSVNIPSIHQAAQADYCGIVSGYRTDKSGIFRSFYGKTGAPMIEECPVNLECRVVKTVELYEMEIFIGEVRCSYMDERCLEQGKPNTLKINPLLYDIGHVYRSWGEWSAPAYSVGKQYESSTGDERKAENEF